MQDEFLDRPGRAAARPSNGRFLALALVAALALGALVALWVGRQAGWVDFDRAAPAVAKPATTAQALAQPVATSVPAETARAALDVRLADLEQRMTQLNLQAAAASGNAARAEGLLVASATRRAVERGAPLGYLENQLKLRFADAQPNAVETLIATSRRPVTLDVLGQGLRALEPALARAPSNADAWTKLRGEFAELFVVRRIDAPSPAPARRLERAQMFLDGGRVEAAIGEVRRTPGAAQAEKWLALADQYVRAQRALDLIETAALLEPRRLRDGNGAPLAAPNPLASPATF